MYQLKMLLGKRIKELRLKHKFTQEKLSEIAEIEISSLSNIENGKNYPNHDTLRKIAEALKVKPYELYLFEQYKPHKELLDEMFDTMKNDEELTMQVYKFFQCIK